MKHKCPRCGTEFEGNFCPECGEKRQEEKTCPKCGTVLRENAKFCNHCGYSFENERSAPSASAPSAAPAPSAPPAAQTQTLMEPTKAAKLYAFLKILPAALLALFAGLSFLFFLAPVAVMPGGELLGEKIPSQSYGNVYQIGNFAESSLPDSLTALIVFAVFIAVSAVAALYALFAPSMKHKTIGEETVSYAAPLSFAGYLFVFVVFLLSCILFGLIGKEDGGMGLMKAGAAPVLLLVFSLLFLLLAAAAAVGCKFLLTRCPDAKRICEEKQNRRAAEYAQKIAEAQQNLVKPEPPEEVQKPQTPVWKDDLSEETCQKYKLEVAAYNKKRTNGIFLVLFGVLLSALIIIPALEVGEDAYYLGKYLGILDIFRSIFVPGSLIMFWLPFIALFAGWLVALIIHVRRKPEKMRFKPKTIFRWKRSLICFIIVDMIFLIIAIGFPIVYRYGYGYRYRPGWLVNPDFRFDRGAFYGIISGGISLVLFSLIGTFMHLNLRRTSEELAAKLSGTTDEWPAYRAYKRDCVAYSYQSARYEKGKSYEASYPAMWCYAHRILLSGLALLLVAAIVLACALGTRDNRFKIGTVEKIELSYDGGWDYRYDVEAILGKPDEQPDGQTDERRITGDWVYYSKNYLSLKKDLEKISEKIQSVSDLSELQKLMEQSAELEKKFENLTYQTISVSFRDGGVIKVKLNAAQTGTASEKKEVESVELSDVSRSLLAKGEIPFAIVYEDGSYQKGYLPSYALPDTEESGSYMVEWSDSWGSYSAELHVG